MSHLKSLKLAAAVPARASADPMVRSREKMIGIPAAKAVCPDLLIGFKSMAYVMRYNHFTH